MKKLNPKLMRVFFTTITTVLFILMVAACTNKSNKEVVTAISLTKMNVLYVGVDNPVVIAVSGHSSDEIEVSVPDDAAKITVTGEKGQFIINPKRPGVLTMVVKAKGITMLEAMFRVKALPNPVVMVNGQQGGYVDKDVLAAQEEVTAFMPNFDFDLKFTIQSFVVSTADKNGYMIQISSDSNKLTEQQKELIKKLKKGQRVNFEEVKAMGPDGSIRDLPAIVFEIIQGNQQIELN